MSAELSSGGKHSLRRFLDDLVWKHFFDDVRLEEPGVTQYVSKMLVDFVDVGNLYRLQNAQGKRLEDVGEMLIESNPMLEVPGERRKIPPNEATSPRCLRRLRASRQGVLCNCVFVRSIRVSG